MVCRADFSPPFRKGVARFNYFTPTKLIPHHTPNHFFMTTRDMQAKVRPT